MTKKHISWPGLVVITLACFPLESSTLQQPGIPGQAEIHRIWKQITPIMWVSTRSLGKIFSLSYWNSVGLCLTSYTRGKQIEINQVLNILWLGKLLSPAALQLFMAMILSCTGTITSLQQCTTHFRELHGRVSGLGDIQLHERLWRHCKWVLSWSAFVPLSKLTSLLPNTHPDPGNVCCIYTLIHQMTGHFGPMCGLFCLNCLSRFQLDFCWPGFESLYQSGEAGSW